MPFGALQAAEPALKCGVKKLEIIIAAQFFKQMQYSLFPL